MDNLREYHAIIWIKDDVPGKRVSIFAKDVDDAFERLEEMHGKGTVFNLHNEEEANRKR